MPIPTTPLARIGTLAALLDRLASIVERTVPGGLGTTLRSARRLGEAWLRGPAVDVVERGG